MGTVGVDQRDSWRRHQGLGITYGLVNILVVGLYCPLAASDYYRAVIWMCTHYLFYSYLGEVVVLSVVRVQFTKIA